MESESPKAKPQVEGSPSPDSDLDNSADEPKKPSEQIMRHEPAMLNLSIIQPRLNLLREILTVDPVK